MSTEGVGAPEVPLSGLLRTAGLIALTVAGAVIFVPALLFLIGGGDATLADWLAWLIPLGVWTLGFTPAVRPFRAWIQAGAGLLFMLMSAVVPGDPWIPVSTVAFAVVVAGIFTLPWRSVLHLIAITAAMDISLALVPSARLDVYEGGPIPALTGAALQILAGGGLLIAWRSWVSRVERADAEYAEIRTATETRERMLARRVSSDAVARRIHETVLNTFAAISIGVDPHNEEAARATCRRDLEQLELGLRQLPDSTLTEIVESARGVTDVQRVHVELADHALTPVSSAIANPLRDAIAEALRNVERHSGSDSALIRARVDSALHVEISDRGVGISEGALERFGLRNAIRTGIESIGGHVDVSAARSGGTVVTLSAPLLTPAQIDAPRLALLGVLDASPVARLGVLGTNLFMLLFAVPVALALPGSAWVLTGMLLYIAFAVLIALLWTRRARMPLTLIAVVVLILTLTGVATLDLTCASEWAVVVLLTGMSGGAVLLPLISLRGWVLRLGLATVVSFATFSVALAVPPECRAIALLTAFGAVSYMLAFAIGLTWADVVFEGRRERARTQWRALLHAETQEEALRAALTGWSEVGPGARDLLEGLADGSLGFDEPGVRARAAAEGAAIRESLGFADAPGDAVSHLTRRLVRAAAHVGATVDVEILTPFSRADRYPDDVLLLLEGVVRGVPDQNLIIRGFSDEGYEELVMVVPNEAIQDHSTRFVQDCAIQVAVGEESSHIIVRRRETQTSFTGA